jgi:hypothetical protein
MKIKLSYSHKPYTEEQFLELIRKRVRKELKGLKPKKQLVLYNDGSKEFKVAKHFLQHILKQNTALKITKKKHPKVVQPTNLDREISAFFTAFTQNNRYKPGRKILSSVTEEEIVCVCKMLKFPIGKKEKKNSFIEKLERKHPGTKFAIYKSMRFLEG